VPAEPRVVLYGKPGCHLCDDARAVVVRVTRELGEAFVERDITRDPDDLAYYGESIPVVEVDGRRIARWHVPERVLRDALGTPGAD
jgi:hypothetical protein